MTKKIYKFIDLFCGIGGFRIGLERNGGKCVFSSDIDVFAQQTYRDNFGETPIGDITKVEAKDIPSFDILAAGFPCQPFSYAGLGKGLRIKQEVPFSLMYVEYCLTISLKCFF